MTVFLSAYSFGGTITGGAGPAGIAGAGGGGSTYQAECVSPTG